MELLQPFMRPTVQPADMADAAVSMWTLLLSAQPINRVAALFERYVTPFGIGFLMFMVLGV